jgi:L-threonylcarbamoyladenylate synthase
LLARVTDLSAAAAALGAGQVVAIPTDTVYGLAVDPSRPGATAALFELKGRPSGMALAVLVADLDQADALASHDGQAGLSTAARRLAERFWPGALTLVTSRRAGIDWDLGGDPATLGLRCPADDVARSLCATVGPLAATSANRHGEPPLQIAGEVIGSFGTGLLVIDGGRRDGLPSTVVDLTTEPMRCRRAGEVSWEDVLAAVRDEGDGLLLDR